MLRAIHKHSKAVLALPRSAKRSVAIITDASLCIIALWIALFLRLDDYQFSVLKDGLKEASAASVIIAIPVFWLMGLYRTMFRYSSSSVFVSVSVAILVYGLLYFSIISIYGIKGIPRSIGILQPIILLLAVISSRLFAEYFLVGVYKSKKQIAALPKALIYGAGKAGRELLHALNNSNAINVVAFIDDDNHLHGQIIDGRDIFSPSDLASLIDVKEVSHVLLAIPSAKRSLRLQILKKINQHKVLVRALPSVEDIIKQKVTTSDIRELEVEDILSRDQVLPNSELLSKNINSKVVLVTGAGGSIGSELCRQILKLNPHKLLLIDINEYSLYKISSELGEIKKAAKAKKHIEIIPLLASVQDKNRITDIVKAWRPDTFYHAAAYKHVPLVEENLCEGIKNNVFGTLVSAQVAIENNVKNMVLVSTDKAVRPTNVMGASKRMAELCLQALYHNSDTKKTKFSIVRFGNVLDSSGSVIPKFRKQIREGGPVTLTHPDVTRYFMTMTEAAQLVIQAGAMTKGCDVFVLDMGNPVKIKDLINQMVKFMGLSTIDEKNSEGDIKIEIIGLRPGEKLFEELLLGENPQTTKHQKIKKAQDPFVAWNELSRELEKLRGFAQNNEINEIIHIFQNLVTGYKANLNIVDKVFLERAKINNSSSMLKTSKSRVDAKVISLKTDITKKNIV